MLIYCSRISLVPTDDESALLTVISDWLTKKLGEVVRAEELHGSNERVLADGSRVEWLSADTEETRWRAIRYGHLDRAVDGRAWLTEIGMCRMPGQFACSVLLRTEERSALVDPNVQTTRPTLVADIFARCHVASDTSGGIAVPLRLTDAEAFLHEVNNPDRTHPIVQVSFGRDGTYLLDPDRVASLLAGVATVAFIPPDVDTYALEDALSERFSCYHGAVNVIWPRVSTSMGAVVPYFRVMAHQIEEVRYRGGSPENLLLATVCNRMNEVYARQHISPEIVRSVRHRAALDEARRAASKPSAELEELARAVDVDQKAQIAKLEADLKRRDDDLAAAQSLIEDLQQAKESLLNSLSRASVRPSNGTAGPLADEARQVLFAAMGDDLALHDCLRAISLLFPDRIVILDSAWKSAKDATEFRHPRKAFSLLHKLCTDYWECVVAGRGDGDARAVFGSAFSARESETVENNRRARSLRTFRYKGRPVEMMMHLRIGNKPSTAETFRAHFEWDAAEKRVVLGHCGKHLDHR